MTKCEWDMRDVRSLILVCVVKFQICEFWLKVQQTLVYMHIKLGEKDTQKTIYGNNPQVCVGIIKNKVKKKIDFW